MKPFSALSAAGRRAACPPAFLPSRGRRPAREFATRELRSEWSISKPGQALPPPPGTDSVPWHQFRPGRQAVAVFDRCGITK